ncbi:MAG TPA: 2,3-diphosphoglycerate synthetase [Actinomycetota bacterium]|nr:2,3-diphosphoglycerate synthetase [Actinomycetota bacterium]
MTDGPPRVVVVVDGEHYPPLVGEAIRRLRDQGRDVVAALMAGGTEKVGAHDLERTYGVPVRDGSGNREKALGDLVATHRPSEVLDLSDEPVVTPADRFRLATVALLAGATYRGADFELRPAPMPRLLTKASLRVIATGKRTGKTAIAGAIARRAVQTGLRPIVIAMGRGGPDPPEVLDVDSDLSVDALVALADAGKHAASDYIEDAVTSRVPTVGCRRVGGGLAGAVSMSNVEAGVRIAQDRDESLVILEGSGAAIPPVAAAAGVICVPASSHPDVVRGYLGPYRVLLSDLAIVTMSEEPGAASEMEAAIREVSPRIEVIRTVFRPKPLEDVSGCKVYVCTTSPPDTGSRLTGHLREAHGCRVVGISHSLAKREDLERELREAPDHDVLLTEVKAGGIDVAARAARGSGRRVVFIDNEPEGTGVAEAFDFALSRAQDRSP